MSVKSFITSGPDLDDFIPQRLVDFLEKAKVSERQG
jgi:hypothetical protein